MERLYGSKRAIPSWIVNTSSEKEVNTFRLESFIAVCNDRQRAAEQKADKARATYERVKSKPLSEQMKLNAAPADEITKNSKSQKAKLDSTKAHRIRHAKELLSVEKRHRKEAELMEDRVGKVNIFKDDKAVALEERDGHTDEKELLEETVEYTASLFQRPGKPAWQAVQMFSPSPLQYTSKNQERPEGTPRYMQGTKSQLGLAPTLFNPKKLRFFATTTRTKTTPQHDVLTFEKDTFSTPAMQLTSKMPNRQDIENGNAFPRFGTPLWQAQQGDPKQSAPKYTFQYEHPRPGWVGSGRKVQSGSEPALGKR
jgi:hypothetical protein